MNFPFAIPYWLICSHLWQWQRLILFWWQSVYITFCCLGSKLNTVVFGFMPLEFLSYCVVLTLALVIQEAFYSEISLIWFSDNTVLSAELKFMISSYILFNAFSFPYSSLHAINAIPCSRSSHFNSLTGAVPYIKLCTRIQRYLLEAWSSRAGWERSVLIPCT